MAAAATDLPAMAQEMIGEHAGHHGLADRHRADADAGIVRPFVTMSVSAPLRSTVRRGDRIEDVGFTANRATTGCPVEMPPKMPPA